MKKSKYLNKKGSFGSDTLVMVVMGLFLFGLFMFVGHKIFNEINDDLQDNFFEDSPESKEIMRNGSNLINGFDMLFIMVLVLIMIGLIVSVYFIDSHPIFFAVSLVIFLAVLTIGAVLSDVFNDISSNAIFANETATYPMTVFVFNNFPLVILIMGAIVTIMLFAKARGTI
jgi:hypothetical protein